MSNKKEFMKENHVEYVNAGFREDNTDSLSKSQQVDSRNSESEPQEKSIKPLSYFSLFQYSTKCEKCLIILAIFMAVISGCMPPIVNILYGEFCNTLIDRQYPTESSSTPTVLLSWFGGGRVLQNASKEERVKALDEDSVAWGLGCATLTSFMFLSSLVSVYLLNYTASQQVSRIKILFFKATVCKDMAWFDTKMDRNFAGKASENLLLTQKGITDVLAVFTYLVVAGVANIIICFLYGWELSLVLVSLAIPLFVSVYVKAKIQSRLTAKEMALYTKAGSAAEEVFSSIRTVTAFGGEKKEIDRYSKHLQESKVKGIKRGLAAGISGGILWTIIYSSYAVAFAYGVRLIQESRENGDNNYTPAGLLIIFFGILVGLTNIGFASAYLETFSVACGAAASVFEVINTKSTINPCSGNGKEGDDCRGEIEFRNVHFEYPSRPSVKILKGMNLKINAGEIVAIVGGSGSGKSTVLQLIQRLYDPTQGEILLDGQNLKSLKVQWLRRQMGVVGQEPLLFAVTIHDNIWYGMPSATDEDIIEAAKQANAHDFISKLKEGYDTMVGQKGSTLSGGQKQRIAIARALIRNPKILILDEATSALDSDSEKTVQAALDRAAQGRTTIVVTHKLSTIENADRIIVLADGVVAEQGTHSQLVKAKGLYNELLQSQVKFVKFVKAKEKVETEAVPIPVVYEDSTILPVGPRGRYGSLSTFSLLSKISQPIDMESMQSRSVTIIDIVKWYKPEWGFFLVGILASIIGGAALPAVCVLFGNLFGLLSLSDFDQMLMWTDFFAIILVILGITAGVCVFLQIYCFSLAGMRLTTRLRVKAFECMVYQDTAWFDDERNKVGALCLRLAQDATGVQESFGSRLGILMQAFSTMTIGTILSFLLDWKMTVVTLCTIPFIFSGVYIESIFSSGPRLVETRGMEAASKIAIEVLINIRAVASLSKESFFIEKYSLAIKDGKKANTKRAWLRSFAFAIGQTAPFFGYAVSLWYGGTLVAHEDLEYKYVVMVSELLIFGAWTLGQCAVIAPSFGDAKAAAGRLQYVFLRRPHVTDGTVSSNHELQNDGSVDFSKVYFTYPTRPGTVVLRNFTLTVKPGQSVGITGPSGSGKSTVIQLLQRFYNPSSGIIKVDNVNVADFKLSFLRQKLGLVSQEPVLFDRTIRENIEYGDNSREVTMSEIIEAANAANIHSFISSLPQGYDTSLGSASSHLSGGQKQRIAIARALVRNPEILLLDEATSALDPQSENVVQDALDKAASGRTTITIAHRLGAVRNADIIHVIDNGSIKESGTHDDLMKLQGVYYSMYASSS